jgi:hypothetical protein
MVADRRICCLFLTEYFKIHEVSAESRGFVDGDAIAQAIPSAGRRRLCPGQRS